MDFKSLVWLNNGDVFIIKSTLIDMAIALIFTKSSLYGLQPNLAARKENKTEI